MTLDCMSTLALSCIELNRPGDALPLLEEALAARRRLLLAEHPDTLLVMNFLGQCYFALNRPGDAVQLLEEAWASQKRVLPKDHPATLASMNNLAAGYFALNRPADALELHQELLAIQRRVFPDGDPLTLTNMANTADALLQLDRGSEAIPLLDEFIGKAPKNQAVDPNLLAYAFGLRMKHFRKAGELAGCQATAEMWEQLNPTDAWGLYDAACHRAVVGSVCGTMPGADAALDAKKNADQAMAWLQKAVQAGFADAAHMRNNPDLATLRDRPDFIKLLGDLEAKFWP